MNTTTCPYCNEVANFERKGHMHSRDGLLNYYKFNCSNGACPVSQFRVTFIAECLNSIDKEIEEELIS